MSGKAMSEGEGERNVYARGQAGRRWTRESVVKVRVQRERERAVERVPGSAADARVRVGQSQSSDSTVTVTPLHVPMAQTQSRARRGPIATPDASLSSPLYSVLGLPLRPPCPSPRAGSTMPSPLARAQSSCSGQTSSRASSPSTTSTSPFPSYPVITDTCQYVSSHPYNSPNHRSTRTPGASCCAVHSHCHMGRCCRPRPLSFQAQSPVSYDHSRRVCCLWLRLRHLSLFP